VKAKFFDAAKVFDHAVKLAQCHDSARGRAEARKVLRSLKMLCDTLIADGRSK